MKLLRLSGVLAHPTSFPSPHGIGDLGEGARLFIDFMKKAKQAIWQILPIGPTSFGDSPYQSFSTFAGNPLLISPEILEEEGYLPKGICDELRCKSLGELSQAEPKPNEETRNEEKRRKFDYSTLSFDPRAVDYGTVINYKNEIYKIAFGNFAAHRTSAQNKAYEAFCQENSFWLDDFALFMSLKNYFIKERAGTFETAEYKSFKLKNKKYLTDAQCDDYFYGAAWSSFPEDIAKHKPEAVRQWTAKLSEDIAYFKFLQYEFFCEWGKIKNYAHENDITIMGDIPIFVAMDSSDVWANPELFYLDEEGFPSSVAGVPPDYFSETGQLWGNPLYNWPIHKKTGYDFWIKRIQMSLKDVDILRIDHFRGFESYWSVPYGEKTAINGKWVKGPGHDLFDHIKAKLGDLPIVAEDLGIITKEVEALRDELELPGMKVLQFSFDCKSINAYQIHNFKSPNTIVYTGTHDNDTTLGWYQAESDEIKDHFRRYMNVSGEDPAGDLMRLAFSSIADYAIVPIQDVLRLDSEDRMNIPGKQGDCWQFRFTQDMLHENLANELAYLSKLFNRLREKEDEEDTTQTEAVEA